MYNASHDCFLFGEMVQSVKGEYPVFKTPQIYILGVRHVSTLSPLLLHKQRGTM